MNALLLLLGDGRFPAGGHAHSGGLEAAVAGGSVHDLSTLSTFLEGRLATAGATDAWAAAAACGGIDADLVEAEYEARCASPALRAAGRAQGRGLKRAAARCWPAVEAVCAEQHPVVLGFAARTAGLSPEDAAALVLHGSLMGGAAAAVRLLPIDMADAVAVVAQLAPLADRIACQIFKTSPIFEIGPPNGNEPLTRATSERSWLSEEWPAWSAPALELGAEHHARWEVRLFAS